MSFLEIMIRYCFDAPALNLQRTRKIICPTLVVKQNPPPWRRLLTEAETISIIPPNMRTPAKQLGNRMRTLVKVQYSKTPYAVIPNRQHRPPSKPLLEIWSLRESVMARYQASEPSEGINVWQRVVGLTIGTKPPCSRGRLSMRVISAAFAYFSGHVEGGGQEEARQ